MATDTRGGSRGGYWSSDTSVVSPCCAEPSPDGTMIAYQANVGPYNIEVMNVDGSNRRSVTSGNGPVWSPDGSRLYIRDFVGSGWQYFEVDLATGSRSSIARQVVRWNHAGSAYLYTYAGNLHLSTAC